MPPPTKAEFYDWVKQEWIGVTEPQRMTLDTARRYLPQNHHAQHALEMHVRAGMTPYLAMLTVQANGGK